MLLIIGRQVISVDIKEGDIIADLSTAEGRHTMAPLAEQVLADEALGQAMRDFGEMVPWGGTARPQQIANVMRFMLSDEADFVCGSLFFVDGGSDAMLRTDDF